MARLGPDFISPRATEIADRAQLAAAQAGVSIELLISTLELSERHARQLQNFKLGRDFPLKALSDRLGVNPWWLAFGISPPSR